MRQNLAALKGSYTIAIRLKYKMHLLDYKSPPQNK